MNKYLVVLLVVIFFSCSNFYPAWVSTNVVIPDTINIEDTNSVKHILKKYTIIDSLVDTTFVIDSSFKRLVEFKLAKSSQFLFLYDSSKNIDLSLMKDNDNIELKDSYGRYESVDELDTGNYILSMETLDKDYIKFTVLLLKKDTISDEDLGCCVNSYQIKNIVKRENMQIDSSIFYNKINLKQGDSLFAVIHSDSVIEFKICDNANFNKYLLGYSDINWEFIENGGIKKLSYLAKNSLLYIYIVENKDTLAHQFSDSLIIKRK